MKTVMLVDGEQSVQQTISSYLAEENIRVLSASTAREALETLEERSEEIVDLILVSRRLPGSGTLEGLYPVKPCDKGQQPAGKVLRKPFTRQQLLSFIKEEIR